jgi:hypothetical protein
MDTPILGQAYSARSLNEADNRLINMFPEAVPEGGKEAGFFNRCPGLKRIATVGTGPIRGLWQYGGMAYIVSGTSLYKMTSAYVATLVGTVSGTGPVSMADNGTQLFIAANGPSYIYNKTTGAFGPITDNDFTGAVTVCYLDGYFVYNEPNNQKLWITKALDGTNIDALDFASAEGMPDNIVALASNFREVWLFGTNSIEVWYDSGSTDFPLARIQGAFNEFGCAAAYSICKMDNGLFWLGSDARGKGIVYRANGYSGLRISTHAVEYAIAQYDTIADAVAYTYQMEGHSFYVLNFPSAGKTWVYDVATQAWHERAAFFNGNFVLQRPTCQMAFNNQIIVGDYADGRLYEYSLDVYADDDQPQKWLRSWRALPAGSNELTRTAHHSLQLDIEGGVGLNNLPVQGGDPEVMLRWSDDGGHTWGNEHWAKMGKIGEYFKRVIWRRLGMTLRLRDRVYEVSGTDPVKISIMGAKLVLHNTNA